MQVYIDNYIQNQANTKQATHDIINNQAKFKEQIKSMFKDINTEHTIKQLLQLLKQKGLALRYVADFKQFAAKTDQNNTGLCQKFYHSLKDLVKDKMMCIECLDKLDKMIKLAIQINN